MKKIVLWILFLALLSAILPFTAGIKHYGEIIRRNHSETEKSQMTEFTKEETDIVISTIMEYIAEDSDTEYKKAVVTLCKNNALAKKDSNEELDIANTSSYSDSFYEEIKDILAKDTADLYCKGKRVYIPLTNLSPGYIVQSADFPYITSVACPWDTQDPKYNKNYDYPCGLSANGIKSLCDMGFDYKYVLSYFLPEFSIK